jgi:hypothetical protein
LTVFLSFLASLDQPLIHVFTTVSATILVKLWVDDCLIASKSKAKALEIVFHLNHFFEMTSGPADCFIGLEITRDHPLKKLYLTQSIFIEKLITKFRMNDCNLPDVPADPCPRLTVASCPTGRIQTFQTALPTIH